MQDGTTDMFIIRAGNKCMWKVGNLGPCGPKTPAFQMIKNKADSSLFALKNEDGKCLMNNLQKLKLIPVNCKLAVKTIGQLFQVQLVI